MIELKVLKEAKTKTLEKIINKFGKVTGNLHDMKLSIWDVREILYDEINKIGKRVFEENF